MDDVTRSSRRKREGLFAMDGVQRILVLSFTARMRNVSRGREAPEEWASLFLFFLLAALLSPLAANATDLVRPPNSVAVDLPVDKNSPEYQAAKGFEIHFMQEMMRNMRRTIQEDPETANTPGHKIFQGMLDDQYAETASRAQGIGLAEMIVRQLHERAAAGVGAQRLHPVIARPLNKSDVIRK